MPQRRAAAVPASGDTLGAQLAFVSLVELAVSAEAELARDDDEIAGPHERHVIGDGRRRCRQRNAQFLEFLLDSAHVKPRPFC